MPASNKIFRIESFVNNEAAPAENGALISAGLPNPEALKLILDEIGSIKKQLSTAASREEIADTSGLVEENRKIREEMHEASRLRDELQDVQESIADTKREIATVHVNSFDESSSARTADELDAVVAGTERATETILSAAELIDERAQSLSAGLKGTQADLANDISEQVVEIFEACNFQDLSGQRINKVITNLRFIENRVQRMMEIWGGIESFKTIAAEKIEAQGDKKLLNGPALDDEENVASQDDIDALFG